MSKPTHEQTVESYFGEVISTYTRAQAIEDGVLIDAGPLAAGGWFQFASGTDLRCVGGLCRLD